MLQKYCIKYHACLRGQQVIRQHRSSWCRHSPGQPGWPGGAAMRQRHALGDGQAQAVAVDLLEVGSERKKGAKMAA